MATGGQRRGGGGIVAAVCAALIMAAPARPIPGQILLDRVLAVVSGTVITLSDARAAIALGLVDVGGARDPVAAALKWLIERQLVLDEAARYEATDPDMVSVEAALLAVRMRFPSDAAWVRTLLRLGLTEESARLVIGDTVYAQGYVDRRFETLVAPSEDDLRAVYQHEPERFSRSGRVRPFDEARADIEAAVQRDRRAQAIVEWIGRLRRRADVSELYVPAR